MTADWTGGSFFMSLIQLRDLKKTYKTGKLEFEALKGVDLEGLFLAFLGWVVGIPLGWVVYRIMAAAMASGMKLMLPDNFALMYVGWSFVFAMVGTLIVIFLPLRRATNMKPGDAIRYE
jgi:ABC-type antimicrobial peptide transport system permease subunit